ncbi:hypothetical protein FRC07_014242 [Ceratobasidium sp. 392]|nr:hypothetical protein FRC07_014242 [Ceratobasidium sp. 392]
MDTPKISPAAHSRRTGDKPGLAPRPEPNIGKDEDTVFVVARVNQRKQVLRELIDELIHEEQVKNVGRDEPKKEKAFNYNTTFNRQPPDEVEGLNKIQGFSDTVTRLDAKLQSLADVVRQLGSSLAMFSAAYRVRVRLQNILSLFHKNVGTS